MLRITEDLTRTRIGLALEAARLKGMFDKTATFPAAGPEGTEPVPSTWSELADSKAAEMTHKKPEPVVHPDSVFDLDFRKIKGLETIFNTGRLLPDTDHDFFPDAMDVRFELPENADVWTVSAACDLACRLGMETTAFSGTLLAEDGYTGNVIRFLPGETCSVSWQDEDGRVVISVKGKGEKLSTFIGHLCEDFPAVNSFDSWTDLMITLCEDLSLAHADGQLAAVRSLGEEAEGATAFVSYDMNDVQKAGFPKTDFQYYREGTEVYRKSYDLPWEVDEFRGILKEKLYPVVRQGDEVRILAAVSEEQAVRERLVSEIDGQLQKAGAAVTDITIVDAYKQGLSWIREKVLPALAGKSADRVEIAFKPFLPEGQTRWSDENGATPNKIRLLQETPDLWFDLPIRYLQELYPVEDMIVSALGIGRDAISFTADESGEDITYRFRAFENEKVILEETCKAACSERPFMDEFPGQGLVHPSTGYVKAFVNGKPVLDERIRTDLETVWDTFQAKVLPDCRAYTEKEFEGRLCRENQPFFKELHLDLSLSETEYRTGSREDMVSPLNALHEDLYFTATDYFKYLGQKEGDGPFDAPGLVLPDIHKKEGKPEFTVTLKRQLREQPSLEKDGKVLIAKGDRRSVEAWVSSLSEEKDGLRVTIQTGGVSSKMLAAYASLLQEGKLNLNSRIKTACTMVLRSEDGEEFIAECVPSPAPVKDRKITQIDLMEDRVIGYGDYLRIMDELSHVEGIDVESVAHSYEGRTIYAVTMTPAALHGSPLLKRQTLLPVEYINARHHANEVSSTNAAFMLLRELLTQEKYRNLADRLNLVIVPMENVDGTAIHERLSAEHPNWKLHTARFNALGKEFAGDYYEQEELHTEALAYSRILHRFVPDIVVDNHGVPSHEWEQQFSGYTSPAYKGFWLPRSLLYGYFWYAREVEYTEQSMPINKKMEDVIAEAIGTEPEMAALNREWAAQFEKYAHSWMPALFPANYYKGMINYWIPFTWSKNLMYAAPRYPWVTSVSYTSEVADETAQGTYLNLCARAHLVHDLATIDMILGLEPETVKAVWQEEDGSIGAINRRVRPLRP